jgi:hypothetical protein
MIISEEAVGRQLSAVSSQALEVLPIAAETGMAEG